MTIEWTDEMKVGVPAMDAEHREMIAIANRFLAAAEDGALVPTLAAIMAELLSRTRAHFQSEERLLDRHNYPDLAGHRSEHDRLMAEAMALHEQFSSGHADHIEQLKLDTAYFLQNWLLDHIRNSDKRYRPFVMSLA